MAARSLGFYLFREPKSAKSLHTGIIGRAVDEYWQFREKIPTQPIEQQLGNPCGTCCAPMAPALAVRATSCP
jgi:hypothetical protein